MQSVYRAIEEQGGVVCAATRAQYEAALASLSTEWRNVRALPCDILYYDSLEFGGLAERQVVTLRHSGGRPYGCEINFRLPA